jgi:hypothetical protein
MVNLTNNSVRHKQAYLERVVKKALNRAMNLRTAANSPAGTPAWQVRPTSICFDMIGSSPLGWAYPVAAAAVVKGTEDWFNVRTKTVARRAQITTIKLMVPRAYGATAQVGPNNPAIVKKAWVVAMNAAGMLYNPNDRV